MTINVTKSHSRQKSKHSAYHIAFKPQHYSDYMHKAGFKSHLFCMAYQAGMVICGPALVDGLVTVGQINVICVDSAAYIYQPL